MVHGDANAEIRSLCDQDWSTIQAVAGTKAIDMWLIFPFGIGVNRLLPRSGEIPESWRLRLDHFLGTEDWYDAFYRVAPEKSLFGEARPIVVRRSMEAIGRFFIERLAQTFPAVCKRPGILVNSRGCPLYLLCFAAANRSGAPIAMRIAEHLLRGLS